MSSAERVRKHREQERAIGRDRFEVRGDRADRELIRRLTATMAHKPELRDSIRRLLDEGDVDRPPIMTFDDLHAAFQEGRGPDEPDYIWPERDRAPDREVEAYTD